MRSNGLISLIALVLCSTAVAGDGQYRLPSDGELEKAQKKLRIPSATDVERQPIPPMPNMEALGAGPSGKIDVGSLASKMEQMGVGENPLPAIQPQLYVFISLSMPKHSLERILDVAERTGAVVVLRGMKERSLRKTFAAVQELIGQRQVGVGLNPQLFQRFGVTSVPAIVLAKPEALAAECQQNKCVDPKSYAKLTGDVSIDYGLDLIERQAPTLRNESRFFLAKFKGR